MDSSRRKTVIKNVFEQLMAEKISNLKEETDIQIQEAERVSNKINSKRPTSRHFIIRMTKLKIEKAF